MGKRARNFIDITGQRFRRLVAKEFLENDICVNKRWLCECDCGNMTRVTLGDLKNSKVKSCGCLAKEVTTARNYKHGHSKREGNTGTYISWLAMHTRCNNPKATDYEYYGGRGIKICERWNSSFDNFLADMGEKPKGLTIDRIDNSGNYEPGNCTWATRHHQMQNTRFTRLNPAKVRMIRRLYKDLQFTKVELAYAFKVSWDCISKVINRITWANIT